MQRIDQATVDQLRAEARARVDAAPQPDMPVAISRTAARRPVQDLLSADLVARQRERSETATELRPGDRPADADAAPCDVSASARLAKAVADGQRGALADMNRHQMIALEHHCRLAEETLRPQLRYVQLDSISIVLSVNSGYE